jgi:ketosteroid isomerase-like protein
MPARHPEELDRLFSEALNAGDLDALAALYEPHATIRPIPGEAVHGIAAIREALAGFIGMKPTIRMSVKTLGHANGLALTTSRWELTGTGPDGSTITMNGQGVEVARQQADGTWRFVIDTPWGLGWDA